MTSPQVGEQRKKPFFRSHDLVTVKVTSQKLVLLSKMLSFLHGHFNVLSFSDIMLSRDTWQYYAYVNISYAEVEKRLQSVTPYGVEQP